MPNHADTFFLLFFDFPILKSFTDPPNILGSINLSSLRNLDFAREMVLEYRLLADLELLTPPSEARRGYTKS